MEPAYHSITLFRNQSEESIMAQQYLSDHGYTFRSFQTDVMSPEFVRLEGFDPHSLSIIYNNVFQQPEIPSLCCWEIGMRYPWLYLSFGGVKDFIRNNLARTKKFEGNLSSRYGTDSFYSTRDEDGRPQRMVTCFDQQGKIVFHGPIDQAPHPLEQRLVQHPYKNWHRVSSWRVDSLKNLAKRLEGHIVADPQTLTLLFRDEVASLAKGQDVVTTTHSSMYQVLYTIYFQQDNIVYGLHASMLD